MTSPTLEDSNQAGAPAPPARDDGTLDAAASPNKDSSSPNKLNASTNDIINTSHLVPGTLPQKNAPATNPDTDVGLIAVSSASSLSHGHGSFENGSGGNRTLYLGNLHPFVTEATLQDVFAGLGGITELKVIKDKATGVSAGYGFAKFTEQASAQVALDKLNKCILFGQDVRINWAFQKDQQEEVATHVHIFVGDLSPDVTDAILLAAFQNLPGCSEARVMWDHASGRSRGYGFVSFRTTEDAEGGIAAMHGQFVGSRRVRCGMAQHKTEGALPMDPTVLDRVDPTNTNIYVGNLAPQLSDVEVRRHFATFGPVAEVKLHRKGSFGFVRYKAHEDAVRAILGMNGALLGGKALKCSWGRHPNTPPSGVKASLMLAAAAGINPLGIGIGGAGGGAGGVGGGMRNGLLPQMNMMQGNGIMGMPMASTGAQGILQQGGGGGGSMQQMHAMQAAQQQQQQQQQQLSMGLQGQDGLGGLQQIDPSHAMYAMTGYGIPQGYGNHMGQMFFAGQHQQ